MTDKPTPDKPAPDDPTKRISTPVLEDKDDDVAKAMLQELAEMDDIISKGINRRGESVSAADIANVKAHRARAQLMLDQQRARRARPNTVTGDPYFRTNDEIAAESGRHRH